MLGSPAGWQTDPGTCDHTCPRVLTQTLTQTGEIQRSVGANVGGANVMTGTLRQVVGGTG